jgi:hypothetical protein
MPRPASRLSLLAALMVVVAACVGSACRRSDPKTPPVATASLRLSRDKAPLGSPIDFTYKFVVASDAHFDQDYRVMMHVVDADGELIWTDDHNPPTPTSQWKPGQTIEYPRTIFVPVYPYVGEATLQLGLYSPTTQKRLVLDGDDAGQRAYRAAKLQLQPQSENLYTVFKDGWHPAEAPEHSTTVAWQWTKKVATLSFKNPMKDCTFFLDLDNPGGVFNENQQVTVTLGDTLLETIALTPKNQLLRRIPITAAQLGDAEMVELHIAVDKTFVPMDVTGGASKDPRELGVRVFHAFIQPNR